MKQFVDFKKWLQTKLDAIQAGFVVSDERNLNAKDFVDKQVCHLKMGYLHCLF